MTATIHELPPRAHPDFPILGALESDYVRQATAGASSWPERCAMTSNLISDSVNRLNDWILPHQRATEEGHEVWDHVLLALHLAINDVVVASGEAAPTEDAAACLFALSSDPAHRLAARLYADARYLDLSTVAWKFEGDGLGIFWNLSRLLRPGLSEFHRAVAGNRVSIEF